MASEAEAAAELARRIAAGDAAAESELVERYSRGVLYLLRRTTRDPDLADDLHQETFRVVLERLRGKGIAEPERLAGFIRSTARNLFIGDYRKRARRDTLSSHCSSPGWSSASFITYTSSSRLAKERTWGGSMGRARRRACPPAW